jgi:Na+-transporting NADH:ubiquinone oxidoreductase subunit C
VKGNAYVLSYAGILGAVCALLLTAVASFTRPYQEANASAERKRNILNVLQVPYPKDASSGKLVEIFEANVKTETRDGLEIYRYTPAPGSGGAPAVAVHFEGPGLWGPIKGFLALDPDMRTIRGVTFYEQEETPGLGGEIVSTSFRNGFVGKKIVGPSGQPGIIIKKGAEKNAVNEVDAISGATLTCDKLQQLLDTVIKQVIKETSQNG